MEQASRRLRWPALGAFALAFFAWFPLAPVWKSDDLIAVQYAMDLSRVLHDFVGNQYGLPPGMVWFYRPLVTFSFWVDGMLAGHDPVVWCWISHLSNALAHATSAAMLCVLAARFFARRIALWMAILWAVAPGHAGSIAWAVGRVDSHTTAWILLSGLAYLRWQDGTSKSRALALVAQVLALMTKELALVVPGIVAVLAFCAALPGTRVRTTVRGVWPFVLVQVAYLGYRYLLFGRVLGGYEGGVPGGSELARGLATFTAYGLNPLAYLPIATSNWSRALCVLGYLPAAIGFAAALRAGLWKPMLACLTLYLGCALPALQFWPHSGNLLNLRYFYLPLCALVAIVACGRASAGILALVVCCLPLVTVRLVHSGSQWAHHAEPVRELGKLQGSLAPGAAFLALPELRDWEKPFVNPFHLGIDRLAQPPFGPGKHRFFAARPIIRRLGDAGLVLESPPPFATLLGFDTSTGWWTEPTKREPPTFATALDGPDHWSSQLFWDIKELRARPAFLIRGLRAGCYRITVFTAGGWISAVCADEAAPGASDGRIGFGTWLMSKTTEENGDAYVVRDLTQATVLDLDLRFPVWIEAGERAPGPGGTFRQTHAASQFLWITLDRDYAQWVAGRRPDRH